MAPTPHHHHSLDVELVTQTRDLWHERGAVWGNLGLGANRIGKR